MKKLRFSLVLLAVVCMVFSFASCRRDSSGGEVTLEFWMQRYGQNPMNQQNFMDRITEQFHRETGIRVNVTHIDWGMAHTRYTLAASGGEAPDVADTFFPYSWVRIGDGRFGPMIIDDVVAEIGYDGFYEVAYPECFIDGHWYALPWRGDTRAAAYNQQIFDEAGITEFPRTYDELLEVGRRLTTYNADGSIDRAGFLFRIGDARFDQSWFALLAGHGGRMMNENYTQWTLNTPEVRESLQFMYDAVFTHNIVPAAVIDPTYNSNAVFWAGKAAIILGATPDDYVAAQINAPQIAPYIRSALMPSKTGDGISSIAFAAPVCIYMTTRHPEEAKEWLKFFVSKDVQLEAMKVLGLVSSWLDVMNDPFFQDDPWFRPFTIQTRRTNPGDMPIPEFSEIGAFPAGPLNTMIARIMAGTNVQTSVNQAITEIDAIMARR